ncbi:hypothetical protein [Sporolactobacillus pectinivorans]|uniref:hypothetical protein n=1 Tax=Sporolactobacillus pectinivorans TaxID=1591408 RepID=UPI000C25D112|nr:hypothetical protein [Sporolactobacillus pectinivorans]
MLIAYGGFVPPDKHRRMSSTQSLIEVDAHKMVNIHIFKNFEEKNQVEQYISELGSLKRDKFQLKEFSLFYLNIQNVLNNPSSFDLVKRWKNLILTSYEYGLALMTGISSIKH